MRVNPAGAAEPDTVALPIFDEEPPADAPPEARPVPGRVAVWHRDSTRVVGVGMGRREELTDERARVAAAKVVDRARELGSEVLRWEAPDGFAAAIVEGTLLTAYGHERFKSSPAAEETLRDLLVDGDVDEAALVAEAVNACRDLQNAPANVMTPTALGERAAELAADVGGLRVTVEGPDQIEARGMGSFMAVARGSYEEPRLITLTYAPAGVSTPHLAFVGKAVTFDSGGISIKSGAKMADMKFDMSGGAAVVEAIGAIARLGLQARVTGVVGATENMPSGRSMRPSDVVTAMNGTTIEVINTDCEGRMVLADCLAHAVALGAERIIDLATLTGAMASFFGSTYAGVLGDDDEWVHTVCAAGDRTGELVWRLPLHDEYEELIKGSTGDLVNLNEPRCAGAITAAHFLKHFTGGVPWAHIDMAGPADGLGRAYAPKGGSGWGVRLLVALAAQVAEDSGSA